MRPYVSAIVCIFLVFFYSFVYKTHVEEEPDKETVYVTTIDSDETALAATFLCSSIRTSSAKPPDMIAIVPSELSKIHMNRLQRLKVQLIDASSVLSAAKTPDHQWSEKEILRSCKQNGFLVDGNVCPLWRLLALGVGVDRNIIYLDPNLILLRSLRHLASIRRPLLVHNQNVQETHEKYLPSLAIFRPNVNLLEKALDAFSKNVPKGVVKEHLGVNQANIKYKRFAQDAFLQSFGDLIDQYQLPFRTKSLCDAYEKHTLCQFLPSSLILQSWPESAGLSSPFFTETPSSASGVGELNKLNWVWAEIDHKLRDLHAPLLEEQQKNDCSIKRGALDKEKYTVMINAFDMDENRRRLLLTHTMHYARHELCDQIILVWNNLRTTPPTTEELRDEFGDGAEKVISSVQVFDSLNNRFRPLPEIRTEAVVITDDDIVIKYDDVRFALETWKRMPHVIVGSFARGHETDHNGGYIYMSPDNGMYSIVLTKFMILHVDFLREYTCALDHEIRSFVDQKNNCEDIAMNFIVSHLSSAAPMIVETVPEDYGTTSGISSQTGHSQERHECVTRFSKRFSQGTPLIRNPMMIRKYTPAPLRNMIMNVDGNLTSNDLLGKDNVVHFSAFIGIILFIYLFSQRSNLLRDLFVSLRSVNNSDSRDA
eukprot:TRINITY_DN12659_c0_g1_i1.p1 TRINITY_DN12659_c0_g1~~TRINITY_DN12659_c0_g1_i1.p1  ORF type:complete len:653 (+),score=149.89 TRINITY_DN12659_c0_g1_i1:85-2043(+)